MRWTNRFPRVSRTTFKLLIFEEFNHDSYSWRDQIFEPTKNLLQTIAPKWPILRFFQIEISYYLFKTKVWSFPDHLILFLKFRSNDNIGLLPTNFLDLDIFEMLFNSIAISTYVRLGLHELIFRFWTFSQLIICEIYIF